MSNVADKIRIETAVEIARAEKYLSDLKKLVDAINIPRKKRKYTKRKATSGGAKNFNKSTSNIRFNEEYSEFKTTLIEPKLIKESERYAGPSDVNTKRRSRKKVV